MKTSNRLAEHLTALVNKSDGFTTVIHHPKTNVNIAELFTVTRAINSRIKKIMVIH